MIQKRTACYCAFCKTTRKVYTSQFLNIWGIAGILIFSYILTLVIWEHPDIRGLGVFGFTLVIAESFTQLRWRQSMICQNCGFDAVLYIKDKNLAAAKIKDYMKIRESKPEFLLKPSLPRAQHSKDKKLELKVNNPISTNLSLHG